MIGATQHPITAEDVLTVVREFYARVRCHPELGPVFSTHVAEWPNHEAKIAQFWRSALLHERGYDGNPMQKHIAAGNVNAEHFPIWLDLFDSVLADLMSQQNAARWSALAHRIGQSLTFGLVQATNRADDAIPSLR